MMCAALADLSHLLNAVTRALLGEDTTMPPVELVNEPPFGNLARQMNKLMDQLHKGYYNFCPSETWTPNVNLYETEADYLVCVDLAGVDKEKIDLLVVDGRLKLRGQREVDSSPDEAESQDPNRRVRVHLMEIDHGSFCREVELPQDVDKERIAATYRNGMLWVQIPKK
jgi:HSP20 family protein